MIAKGRVMMLFGGLVLGQHASHSTPPKVPAKSAVSEKPGPRTGTPFEGLAKGPNFLRTSLGGGGIEATILAHTEAVRKRDGSIIT